MNKPLLLIILDGFGIAEEYGNAIKAANKGTAIMRAFNTGMAVFDAFHIPFAATVIGIVLLIWLYTRRSGIRAFLAFIEPPY